MLAPKWGRIPSPERARTAESIAAAVWFANLIVESSAAMIFYRAAQGAELACCLVA